MSPGTIPPLVLAALKTKNLAPEQLKAWLFEGPDLFLHLAGGGVARVEVSALPALLPLPETAKAVEAPEKPARAQTQPKKRRKKAATDGE